MEARAPVNGLFPRLDNGDTEEREFTSGAGDEKSLRRLVNGDSGRASTIPVLAATIAVVA